MWLHLAAGRRKEGKKADTAHITLVGSWERTVWLGRKGGQPASHPHSEARRLRGRNGLGGAAVCGREALVQRGHRDTLEPCQWERRPPDLARFPKVPASGIRAF